MSFGYSNVQIINDQKCRIMLARLGKHFRRQDWMAFFIEFVLLILGVTIAYQLNVKQQSNQIDQKTMAIIKNIGIENQHNLEDLKEEIIPYRIELVEELEVLDEMLNEGDFTRKELMYKIDYLLSTSFYAFQEDHLKAYLNSEISSQFDSLTNHVIQAQYQFNVIRKLSDQLWELRNQQIIPVLIESVDLYQYKVIDPAPLQTLSFRNLVGILLEFESNFPGLFQALLLELEEIDQEVKELTE